jgi:hypothetical protein
MEIDGHFYIHGAVRIEVEKVRGSFSQFVRVRVVDDKGDTLSFSCWGVIKEFESVPPEVVVSEKDEREKIPAYNDDDDGE